MPIALTGGCRYGTFTTSQHLTPMRPIHSHVCRVLAFTALAACARSEAPSTLQRLSMKPLPSPAGANAAEPFVSASPTGSVMLSWLQREPDSVTVVLRLATLGADDTWSAPAEVVRAKNLFVNWADFPSVVTLADGRLLAHWLQKNGSGKYAYDIRLSSSTDAGRTWTPDLTPHAPGIPAEHGFVTLLPRADSSADILFLNGRAAPPSPAGAPVVEGHGPPMRFAVARWSRGGIVSGAESILDERTCDCCQTAAAVTSRGPVVLYRDRSETETRDISLRRLVNGQWTASTPLHADNWVIDACPVNGPAISASGDDVAAVWFTGARDTAKVQLIFSHDAGATFGAPVRIDDGTPAGRVDVELLDSGDAVVTWIERTGKETSEVRARIVRAADGVAEPTFTVAKLTLGRASGFPRMARRGSTLALAWTVSGPTSAVHVAELRIAPR